MIITFYVKISRFYSFSIKNRDIYRDFNTTSPHIAIFIAIFFKNKETAVQQTVESAARRFVIFVPINYACSIKPIPAMSQKSRMMARLSP